MEYTSFQPGPRRTYQEMRQKPAQRDTFFNMRSEKPRPMSVATEFVDTDWDEDDIISDAEDNSPRVSLHSSGQPSFTTISSLDEVPTPRSSRSRDAYIENWPKQVEGPRGPHLFRSSTGSSLEEDVILTLSPITPKAPRAFPETRSKPALPPLPVRAAQAAAPQRSGPVQYSREKLDISTLVSWTPEMVAQSMLNAGIEQSMAERFIENDINGAILITLKFEDLRELDIPSFGIRTRVWHQIQALRDAPPTSPQPSTPIEDEPSREARCESADPSKPTARSRGQSSRRRQQLQAQSITPMDSVSIIGIEQLVPKPHSCPKGENCSKWRKAQRAIEEFRRANPHVDMNSTGPVMIVGAAGDPATARAIDPNDTMRPFSDALGSVVASSDVMGSGGLPPLQYLREATLRNLVSRDPQDNVRHFLDFQQRGGEGEVPPTPPFQVVPDTPKAPIHGLRHLPRLSIPVEATAPRHVPPPRAATVPPPQQHQPMQQHQPTQEQRPQPAPQEEFVPYRMSRVSPLNPDLDSRNLYRFGTPFSEMDVPVTMVSAGPVARDASQSVPPNMNFRNSPTNNPPARSQSRASSRRPSFPVLPALDENKATPAARQSLQGPSPRTSARSQHGAQAPPRAVYPWSGGATASGASSSTTLSGVSYEGHMKKRKTKMLRNEWQDGYFTLKGSRLNMHKDAKEVDRTLEYVDIDDYAIACSSLASSSKLSAAFKAVSLSGNREKSDAVGAFSFQLIPQDKNGARLRKRDSTVPASVAAVEGVNGTGKTHHFAVKNRDERIDWMRELMLAKAMKQKGEGFEINVNGNMI